MKRGSKRKKKSKKVKVKFSLDKGDISNKKVIKETLKKLKKIRPKIHIKHVEELKFAKDILNVIDEVVTKYDDYLTNGKFSSSPCACFLFRTLNYMIAAYQNIEKMLSEDSFQFLMDYYKILNLDDDVKKKDDKKSESKFESKLGNMGKHHIPIQKVRKSKKRKG